MRLLKYAVAFVLAFCMLAVTLVCSAVVSDESEGDDVQVATEPQTVLVTKPQAPSEETQKADEEQIDDDVVTDEKEGAQTTLSDFTPRLTAPKSQDTYYYRDNNIFYQSGWGMPNCTCYAWGRAYEILRVEPQLCIYDAHLWYDYNKDNGIYAYGQTPKQGAVACFKYTSGTSGHVSVVEKIEGDTVYFSNSAYSGENFYVDSAPVSDPSNGRDGWIFQGYIYIGEQVV